MQQGIKVKNQKSKGKRQKAHFLCLLLSACCLLPSFCFASQICSGGAPNYCARSDRSIQAISPMMPPPVGVPFVEPDFGMQAVRVTGPNTLSAFNKPNYAFYNPSADTVVNIGP